MKITKGELRKLIREYEQYVDEDGNVWDDEGNVTRKGAAFGRRYGGGTYGTNAPWRGGRSRSRYSSRRKTTHVGTSANSEKIAAVEKALEAKPNNFLTSVLSQLKAGRGLSSKQNAIVKRILAKSDKAAASLFEAATLQEFWGKKKPAPAPSQSPLQAASESMAKTVQSLWGQWDNPPRPDLLEKAQDLYREIEAAAKNEKG